MMLDSWDLEVMKLTGLCRYLPTGLSRKYEAPHLKKETIHNLQVHHLIDLLSDEKSYKLTKRGRDILLELGYFFNRDARTDLKKKSYQSKLKNAQWNVMLSLSGVDVYYKTARELMGVPCGYMSSLLLRADNSMKVLSSAKFLGVLKIEDIAYIPYCVENRTDWIFPTFEREMYRSQVDSIREVKDIKLIMVGETLEELWLNVSPSTVSTKIKDGQKPFHVSLEEIGSEYLLIPFGGDGVLQLKLLTLCDYKERIMRAIGCEPNRISGIAECDGWKCKSPMIVGIDFNIKRVLRGLKQIEKYDEHIKPIVCCLPFQESTYTKALRRFSSVKPFLFPISLNDIYNVFPEVKHKELKYEPVVRKGGGYIGIPSGYKTEIKIEVVEI